MLADAFLKCISSNQILLLAATRLQGVLSLTATLGAELLDQSLGRAARAPGWSPQVDLGGDWNLPRQRHASHGSPFFSVLLSWWRSQATEGTYPSSNTSPALPQGLPSSRWSLDLWCHRILRSSTGMVNSCSSNHQQPQRLYLVSGLSTTTRAQRVWPEPALGPSHYLIPAHSSRAGSGCL